MVAVGDAVRAADPSAEVVYVGTGRGIEARVLPERGDRLELLEVLPLRGGGLSGFLKGAARAAASIPAAAKLVRSVRPDVVLSVGGYAAGPVSLAARLLGVPVALLEPNSVVGLANRLLAPLAARAYTAFPEVERHLSERTVVRAGVPLRRAFSRQPYATGEGPMRVLVLGGSQGAKALNEAVPRAIALASARSDVRVVHQTGKDRRADVDALYRELCVGGVTVTPFIDDMSRALAEADVVLGRAGASPAEERTLPRERRRRDRDPPGRSDPRTPRRSPRLPGVRSPAP
jgi:UDP-N-acetylglucosamine--N-acetylmuramyl-(pentapeptide) pyrophosphoryl-undecaprenol N-acetylglucosamine transferase